MVLVAAFEWWVVGTWTNQRRNNEIHKVAWWPFVVIAASTFHCYGGNKLRKKVKTEAPSCGVQWFFSAAKRCREMMREEYVLLLSMQRCDPTECAPVMVELLRLCR